jgi:hypothetical protein
MAAFQRSFTAETIKVRPTYLHNAKIGNIIIIIIAVKFSTHTYSN